MILRSYGNFCVPDKKMKAASKCSWTTHSSPNSFGITTHRRPAVTVYIGRVGTGRPVLPRCAVEASGRPASRCVGTGNANDAARRERAAREDGQGLAVN